MSSRRVPTPIGSFKDAELENIRRIAALAPAQRVKMVCSMQAIVRRVQQGRNADGARTVEQPIRRTVDLP